MDERVSFLAGKDSLCEGWYEIKLNGTEKSISIKQSNIYLDEDMLVDWNLEWLQQHSLIYQGKDKAYFDGLIDRTHHEDVIDTETWSS